MPLHERLRAVVTMRGIVVLLVLALAFWFLAVFSWQGQVVGLVADDAIYLLLSDLFSPYSQAARESAAFVTKHSTFPPLYSLYLSIFGAGSRDVYYAHVLTSITVIAAFGMTIRYFSTVKMAFGFALGAAVLFFLLPVSLLLHVELQSEPMYLAFSLIALAEFATLKGERQTSKVYVIAACVALAVLSRTAGITLLGAFLLWQLTGAGPNRSVKAMLIAVVPFLIWEAIKSKLYTGPWTYTSLLLQAYSLDDPADLMRKLGMDANNLWVGWRQYFDVGVEPTSLPAALLLPLTAAPAFLRGLIARRMDAWYALAYLVLIFIWPFPDHTTRFLYPILPVIFYFSFVSIQQWVKQPWNKYALILLLALTALAALPSTGQIIVKTFSGNGETLGKYAKTRLYYGKLAPMKVLQQNAWVIDNLIEAMRDSAQFVPEGKCVYNMHFEWYMYYARRYARPVTGNDLEPLNAGRPPDCRYMFVNWTNSHFSLQPGYPTQVLHLPYRVLKQYRAARPDLRDGQEHVLAEMVEFEPATTAPAPAKK